MTSTAALTHDRARQYAQAWCLEENNDINHLMDDGGRFFGTLGSLDFQYESDLRILHAWFQVMPGAGPFEKDRPEVKSTLDDIARHHPEETAGGVFDIRTLSWNKQVSAKLEPCLYLRLDIADGTPEPPEVAARLRKLSDAGYIWFKQKMSIVLKNYWRDHPRTK